MEELRRRYVDELQVTTPLLNEHLESQAARYAYWGTLATDAAKEARQARIRAEVIEAQLTQGARTALRAEGGRTSEWAVTALVKGNPSWREAFDLYHEAKHRSDMLQVAKEAFAQRKDLLVTIAANLRGELGGQVRVKQETTPSPFVGGQSTAERLSDLASTYRLQKENTDV